MHCASGRRGASADRKRVPRMARAALREAQFALEPRLWPEKDVVDIRRYDECLRSRGRDGDPALDVQGVERGEIAGKIGGRGNDFYVVARRLSVGWIQEDA